MNMSMNKILAYHNERNFPNFVKGQGSFLYLRSKGWNQIRIDKEEILLSLNSFNFDLISSFQTYMITAITISQIMNLGNLKFNIHHQEYNTK